MRSSGFSLVELSIIAAFLGITVLACWAWALIGFSVWRSGRRSLLRRMAEHAPRCPNCKYDMTGLSTAHCPECGGRFTLDQLWQG